MAESGVVGQPTVVANRVLTPVSATRRPKGVAGDVLALHEALCAEQAEWLQRLPPDLSLPYLFGLFTPGEVAVHVSDELEALR